MTHVYVPDTSKPEPYPCKLCGLPPGGDHRELETLDPPPRETGVEIAED